MYSSDWRGRCYWKFAKCSYLGVAGEADLLDMDAGESDLLRGEPNPDEVPVAEGRFSFFFFSFFKNKVQVFYLLSDQKQCSNDRLI